MRILRRGGGGNRLSVRCRSCVRQTKARDGGWVIWRGDGSLFDARGGEGRRAGQRGRKRI